MNATDDRDYERSLLRCWMEPFKAYGESVLCHWKKHRPKYYTYLRGEYVLEEAVWIAIENEQNAIDGGCPYAFPVSLCPLEEPRLESGADPDLARLESTRSHFIRLPSEDCVPRLQPDQAPFGQPGDKEPYRFPYECRRSLMKMLEMTQEAQSLSIKRLAAEPGRLTQYTIEPKEMSTHPAGEVSMLMFWRMQSALAKTLATGQYARIPLSCFWLKASVVDDRRKMGIWDGKYPPSGRPLLDMTVLWPDGTAPFMLEMSIAGLKHLDFDYEMVLSLCYYGRSTAWAWLLMDK